MHVFVLREETQVLYEENPCRCSRAHAKHTQNLHCQSFSLSLLFIGFFCHAFYFISGFVSLVKLIALLLLLALLDHTSCPNLLIGTPALHLNVCSDSIYRASILCSLSDPLFAPLVLVLVVDLLLLCLTFGLHTNAVFQFLSFLDKRVFLSPACLLWHSQSWNHTLWSNSANCNTSKIFLNLADNQA